MSGDGKQYWKLLVSVAALGLASLACAGVFQGVQEFDCEASGGHWRYNIQFNDEYCENAGPEYIQKYFSTSTPIASSTLATSPTQSVNPIEETPNGAIGPQTINETDAPALGTCYSESSAYEWIYEDFRQNSGTGGVSCDARFIFTNNSNEVLNLIVFTDWDNNAMHESGWKVFMVKPGGSWEYKVSLTRYTDGSVTFSKVAKFLVLPNLPECGKFLAEGNESFWDLQAVSVDDLVCQ